MNISLVSFGFKHGAPADADLMFDVRCFPNPYYIPELKHKTGLMPDVSEFVLASRDVQDFLQHLFALLDHLLPLYHEDGRSHITIAIGCTGGKHRSVTIVEALSRHLTHNNAVNVSVSHRDIQK